MAILKPILATAVLMLAYILGNRLQNLEAIHPRRWLSFGAGASVAYVFVELLPELGEYQKRFLAATAQLQIPFAEQRVFLAALVGFVLYYGLENLVSRSRATNAARGEAGHSRFVYRMHVGGFAAYSTLIGYILVRGEVRTLYGLAFYTIAMYLHFQGIDHTLEREHGSIYRQRGKWALAGATFLGYLIGIMTAIPDRFLSTLMGVVAGGVVVNDMVMELPKEKEGRFGAFCLGAFLYSLILLLA